SSTCEPARASGLVEDAASMSISTCSISSIRTRRSLRGSRLARRLAISPTCSRRGSHASVYGSTSKIIMTRRVSYLVAVAVLGSLLTMAAQEGGMRSITEQDLAKASKDPGSWLMFAGDYNGQRHSQAKQITPKNVANLSPQWVFQGDTPNPGRGLETTPLLVDGVMYVTGNANQAWALDPRTGRAIWSYKRQLPNNFAGSICCGPVNRGFGILGDRLYLGTLDAHLVALDRKTGKVIWDVEVGDLKAANSITMAPLVVRNKVIVGVAGSEFASRGFLDAYDADTGKRAWRFYTIPLRGEPGGDT